jgi:hypothetical protein
MQTSPIRRDKIDGGYMNYEDAKDLMALHRSHVAGKKGYMAKVDPDRKNIRSTTWLQRYEATADQQEYYAIALFAGTNKIIEFHEDFLILNDNGWFSKTTHERFNEFMPRGFRVWGSKCYHLTKPRPLGFIKTPKGTYPYHMPMLFSYDGTPTERLIEHADEVLTIFPKYVELYLTTLLDGITDVKDPHIKKFINNDVITCAVEFSTKQYMGLTLQEIVEVLKKEGASTFTKTTIGRHIESVLLHGIPIPIIHKNWLRKTLRPLIYDYIIEGMGFAEVEWNRR